MLIGERRVEVVVEVVVEVAVQRRRPRERPAHAALVGLQRGNRGAGDRNHGDVVML